MKKLRREREASTEEWFLSSPSVQALYDHENNLRDRISNLPVELLCHILSFLPTKLVFTATTFSKRWNTLCYSLPVLDFHDETFKDFKTFDSFCRFVDNFMFSPLSTNQPLKSFRLNCFSGRNHKHDCSIFNSWLEAAKRRHVEELHLNLYYQTLNPIIFISQTLVVLKLEFLQLGIDTSCVDLPSLKTLHLKSVYFPNRNDYINFLSACPILEDLLSKSIYINNANIAQEEGFKSLPFPRLVRANINSTGDPFYGIDNVELLFTITGSIAQDTTFKVIPLFAKLVHIELLFCCRSLHCWDGVLQLLCHCPNLQILSIGKWMNTSSTKEWKCPISVPECVSSHLRSCTVLNFQGSRNDLKFVAYILQNGSLLRNMKICFATYGMLLKESLIIEEISSCPSISPSCKVSIEFISS